VTNATRAPRRSVTALTNNLLLLLLQPLQHPFQLFLLFLRLGLAQCGLQFFDPLAHVLLSSRQFL
jgi:hypothetical protein